jgi:hypothetical protein
MASKNDTTGPEPHVAEVIEPGAILYSSWGYDQTNIDYYMVTRTTKASAWIVPMSAHEEQTGWLCGQASPLEPRYVSNWCECDHRVANHGQVIHADGGPDTDYCRGAYGDDCPCPELRPRPIIPAMHRIRRHGDHESLTLTSYSSAWLWDGASKYASHYA